MGTITINFPNADSAQLAGAVVVGGGGGGSIPPPPDPGGIVTLGSIATGNPLYPTGINTDLTMYIGTKYTIQLASDFDNCGFASSGGRCVSALGTTQGSLDLQGPNESADQSTITLVPATGAGTWLTFWLGEGHPSPTTGRYSANRYAPRAAAKGKKDEDEEKDEKYDKKDTKK